MALGTFAKRTQRLPGIQSSCMAVSPRKLERIRAHLLCRLQVVLAGIFRLLQGLISSQEHCFPLTPSTGALIPEGSERSEPFMPVIPGESQSPVLQFDSRWYHFLNDFHLKKKKDNRSDCPFDVLHLRGPYRGRTGDLHNAIVALSQAELTALAFIKIAIGRPKVKLKPLVSPSCFEYVADIIMRSIGLAICVFIILALVSGSCKDQLPTEGDYTKIVLPDSNIHYGRDIEPLFTAACVSCHDGSYEPNLTPPSYTSLMNYQPQLVVARDGYNSLLVERLDGRVQPFMPPNGAHLTQNQVNGIKRWIDEGASNN